MATKEEIEEEKTVSDGRKEKVKHNEEVYKKMTNAPQGILGDNYVRYHEERCHSG